ncbi:MAG: hypothetical protein C4304_01805 [candidate division GAL15 bacterium]
MSEVAQPGAGTWEAEALVAEAGEAPAVYRGLSTEYTDVGRLVDYLGDRLFSGVVRVTLPGREAHVVLFRGKPQAVRYLVEGRTLEAEQAVRALLADSRWMDGEVWVHPLPEELFPEEWEDREPLAWESAQVARLTQREEDGPQPAPESAAAEGPLLVLSGLQPQPSAKGAPREPKPEPEATVDVVAWVRLLEGLVARFKRYRGPTAAGRLEAEVNVALHGSGLRLHRGRVEGQALDPQVLSAAVVRAVGLLKGMAGQAFAEHSVSGVAREAGIRDEAPLKRLLEL